MEARAVPEVIPALRKASSLPPAGSGYAGAMSFSTHPGDQDGLLRSCASKTTSSLAEPLDLKRNVCLVWACLPAPRALPCAFLSSFKLAIVTGLVPA